MDIGISSAAGDGYAFTIRRQGGTLFRLKPVSRVNILKTDG